VRPARWKSRWWRFAWLLLALAYAAGYEDSRSLPVWPEGGRIPPELERQYVFLTPDKTALIFRVPADPEAGMEGPLKPVRVQFYTRFDLKVRVVQQTRDQSERFHIGYEVCSGTRSEDPIDIFGLIVPSGPEKVLMSYRDGASSFCWPGSVGSNDVGRQWALDRSLRGRMGSWGRRSDRPACGPILPGACAGTFEVVSPYAPGFASAFVRAGKYPAIDWSWPWEVMIQFDRADTYFLYYKYVLTIGPAFRPATPPEERAENFRKGVSRLIGQGQLRRDSPFVTELLRQLETVRSKGGGVHIETAPETEWERTILEAVKLSLPPE